MSAANNSAHCGKCCNPVTTDDAGIGCEGYCNSWFHKDCVGMSAGDYSTLRKPSCSLMWLCETCKKELTFMKAGKDELKEIRTELGDLKSSLQLIIATELRKFFAEAKLHNEELTPEKQKTPTEKRDGPNTRTEQAEAKTRTNSARTHERTDEKCEKKETINPPTRTSPTKIKETIEEKNRKDVTNSQTERTSDTCTAEEHPQNEQEEATVNITEGIMSNNCEENEHEEPQDEEGYQTVRARRRGQRQRPAVMIGTGAKEITLQIGEKIIWRYIGKLSQETTEEKIISFLHKKGIKDNVTCETLPTLGRNKAFKIGFPLRHREETENPNFWPEGLLIRPFRHQPHRHNRGVDIE